MFLLTYKPDIPELPSLMKMQIPRMIQIPLFRQRFVKIVANIVYSYFEKSLRIILHFPIIDKESKENPIICTCTLEELILAFKYICKDYGYIGELSEKFYFIEDDIKPAKKILDEAEELVKTDNINDAIQLYENAGNVGNVSTAYRLAYMFYNGHESCKIKKDHNKALKWIFKVIERDHGDCNYSFHALGLACQIYHSSEMFINRELSFACAKKVEQRAKNNTEHKVPGQVWKCLGDCYSDKIAIDYYKRAIAAGEKRYRLVDGNFHLEYTVNKYGLDHLAPNECCICMENVATAYGENCAHLAVVCFKCSQKITNCPICRSKLLTTL